MRKSLISARATFGLALALTFSCSSNSGLEVGENTPSIPNLDTPSGVVASANSTSSINIGWGAVSGATGYYIYRSTINSGIYEQVGSSQSISYTDNGLSAGTTYYYRVAAYNSGRTSSQSSYTAATIAPYAPTDVTVVSSSTGSVTVSWNAVSGATSYRIYRDSTQVGTSSTISYTNTGITIGTEYNYCVTAYNSGGESEQSLCSSITIYPKCGTEEYNPATEFCSSGSIYDKCDGTLEYNPAREKCCGSNKYTESTQFCYGNEIYAKCGNTLEYNPANEECCGRNKYNLASEQCCGSNKYSISTEFCSNNMIYTKCGGTEYNPATQFCFNGSVGMTCRSYAEALDLSGFEACLKSYCAGYANSYATCLVNGGGTSSCASYLNAYHTCGGQ
jgi:hypothetical protein